MDDEFTITSLTWIDADNTAVVAVVNGNTVTVPADPGNRHYRYIVKNALAIDPYVPPVLVVDEVKKIQFVKQLKAAGKLTQVRTYVAGLADDDDIRLEWDESSIVEKSSALVAAIKAQLSLSDGQVDTFFVDASYL